MSLYIATIELTENTGPDKDGRVFVNGFPQIKSLRKMNWFDKLLNKLGLVKYPTFGHNSEIPENTDDEVEMLIEVPGPVMRLLHGTDGQYTKICRCVVAKRMPEPVEELV